MTDAAQQLVFELPHRPALGLEDFLVSASNAEAVALIDRWPDWPSRAAILSGPPGSGKSHLAHVWCLKANARTVPAATLLASRVPDIAARSAVVIEDIAAISDETALFHVLNLARETGLAVLLTSSVPPGDLKLSLPDLKSRLKALPVAAIAAPDDPLLRAVLVKLFADRQLTVEPQTIAYLMLRMERSMDYARRLVEVADRQALVLQRAVTRSIAASALEALQNAGKNASGS